MEQGILDSFSEIFYKIDDKICMDKKKVVILHRN